MGLFDEPIADIQKNCLELWDYSGAFPVDPTYTGPKGVIFNNGWPWQLLQQIEAMPNQQMSQPIISIMGLEPQEESRSFSDIYKTGVGAGPLQWRLGRRATSSFLISCWADQQLGGMQLCRKLGGEVYNAIFYYKNRLSTIRHLKMAHSREAEEDAAQLYRFDLVVTGDVFITIDV